MTKQFLKAASVLLLTASVNSFAQTTATGTSIFSEVPPSRYAPKLMMGLKSQNDSGRQKDLNAVGGRTYKGKHEIYLGAKTLSGWGAYGQLTQYRKENRENAKGIAVSKWDRGDTSLTILHPDFYDDGTTRVFGQVRQYFPTSQGASDANQYQTAYYLLAVHKLNATTTLFNVVTPRYFNQPDYKRTDTNFYVEDRTQISQVMSSWFRAGFGQWTQVEWHSKTATGSAVELYPYADFIISKNLYFGPRLSFPVHVDNAVYDGPSRVSTDNAYLQVYLEASL